MIDNLGSGETCPSLSRLLFPSFSLSSRGVQSGTVSLVALLGVPAVWGTSSNLQEHFSQSFHFKCCIQIINNLDKSCKLGDVQTSHAVADLYKMIT